MFVVPLPSYDVYYLTLDAFVCRELGGVGEVPADGSQEGARDVHRDGAGVCVREDEPAGRPRGVHLRP